jgi:serpin B
MQDLSYLWIYYAETDIFVGEMNEIIKKSAIVFFIMALLTGCGQDDSIKETEQKTDPVVSHVSDIELTSAELEMVNSSNEFAFNLFRQISDSATDIDAKSEIVSPLSITYALGMLNNGAAGNTRTQINEVLGFGDTGADSINAFCYKMIKTAPELDSITKVMIANNIYLNSNYSLKEDFVQKVNHYYDAYPQVRDFHDPQTLAEINQWASDHTEQMIDKVLDKDEFNENAVSYLLNALYFKGSWAFKFDKTETIEERFYHPGDTQEVTKRPMMQMHTAIEYAINNEFEAIHLPYGNGSFQMTVLLPRIKEGEEPGKLPVVPTLRIWQELNRSMRPREVILKLPRFETESNMDLIEIMKKLGMTDAFTADADFSNLCNWPPVKIGLMKQVAKIIVDEEGSEAAAVTIIGMEVTMLPDGPQPHSYIHFNANHPFIYVITEKKTGAIFFIGRYTGF